MKHFFPALIFLIFHQVSAQAPITTSLFELFGDHIFVKIQVDDSEPLDFIFDTGDGLSVIDLDVAQSLKLDLDHRQTKTSAQGTISGALIKHKALKINDFILESNIKVYATSLKHLEISIGRNIDGIIGYDMLQHHVVRLNYDNMKLEVYGDNYPKMGEKVAIKLHNAIPTLSAYVTLNSGETLSGTYYLNTGAGTTLDFNTPFSNENNIINKIGDHYSYMVKGIESTETRHFRAQTQTFRFSNFSFDKFPIGISQAEKGVQADRKITGIIGNKLLKRYNLLFDYKNSVIYFEENSYSGSPFVLNSSGIDLQYKDNMSTVFIHNVVENSPADKEGIEMNDELLAINGQSVTTMTLPAMEKQLMQEGERLSLEILRNGTNKTFKITLKSLL